MPQLCGYETIFSFEVLSGSHPDLKFYVEEKTAPSLRGVPRHSSAASKISRGKVSKLLNI